MDSLGPYSFRYSRDGRSLVLSGNKGHVAQLNWQSWKLENESFLNESVRDSIFIQSNMIAVAQLKFVYIYDAQGIEIHCLKKHVDPERLEFLPYHYLLASIGRTGFLNYTDTSTGKEVASFATKLGRAKAFVQNAYNAVLCVGHSNGQLTMWTPNLDTPVVKMWCHRGGVLAAGFDRSGNYLATAGVDGMVKIWDARMYKLVSSMHAKRSSTSLEFSQTGMLAAAAGSRVTVWKDPHITIAEDPYLIHTVPGEEIENARFCPFEDILGISHSRGFNSLVLFLFLSFNIAANSRIRRAKF